MRLACQHPDRVNRLVVVDIAPRDYPAHADRAEFSAMHALPLDHLKTRGDAERFFEPGCRTGRCGSSSPPTSIRHRTANGAG